MSGFRAIEDFAEDLLLLGSRHWLMPPSVVCPQVFECGFQVSRGDLLSVSKKPMVIDQSNKVLAIVNQAQEQCPMQVDVFRGRILTKHRLLFLLAKQLDFMKPYDRLPVESELRIRAENHLGRRIPACFLSCWLHKGNVTLNRDAGKARFFPGPPNGRSVEPLTNVRFWKCSVDNLSRAR